MITKARINLTMTEELKQWIEEKAKEHSVSTNGYINFILSNARKSEELQKQMPEIFQRLEEYKSLLEDQKPIKKK